MRVIILLDWGSYRGHGCRGSGCVYDDILLNSLYSLGKLRVCVRGLAYLGCDKIHGPHIG